MQRLVSSSEMVVVLVVVVVVQGTNVFVVVLRTLCTIVVVPGYGIVWMSSQKPKERKSVSKGGNRLGRRGCT